LGFIKFRENPEEETKCGNLHSHPLMCEPLGFVTEEPRETQIHNNIHASNADAA